MGSTPTGAIIMWPGATPILSGFLVCDGSEQSRTTYSALFGVIGVTYGSGNGVSTFRLPNYMDRMPIGAGSQYAVSSTGGSANAPIVSHTHGLSISATTSGQSAQHAHPLSGSTLGSGSHSHTATSSVTDPGHTHTIFNGANLNSNKSNGGIAGTDIFQTNFSNTTNNSTTGISVSTSINSVGDHIHTFSGNTNNNNVDHSHNVTVTGDTNAPSGAVSSLGANLPPYIGVYFLIKT
jgi:microcystin-dependent protein